MWNAPVCQSHSAANLALFDMRPSNAQFLLWLNARWHTIAEKPIVEFWVVIRTSPRIVTNTWIHGQLRLPTTCLDSLNHCFRTPHRYHGVRTTVKRPYWDFCQGTCVTGAATTSDGNDSSKRIWRIRWALPWAIVFAATANPITTHRNAQLYLDFSIIVFLSGTF